MPGMRNPGIRQATPKEIPYCDGFNGTSSASATVAWAVACLARGWKARVTGASPLSPLGGCSFLEACGKSQVFPP
jgi:hypothetical protein